MNTTVESEETVIVTKNERPPMVLPELMNEDEFRKMVAERPWWALPHARTHSEFKEIVSSITRHSSISHGEINPDSVEDLIKALKDPNLKRYPGVDGLCYRLSEWYASPRHTRSYEDKVRSFRFLLGYRPPGIAYCGGPRAPIYSGGEKFVNTMVREEPSLYWCHHRYQDHLEYDLSTFLKYYGNKKYVLMNWEEAETAIRRIVAAGDWMKHLEKVTALNLRHKEKKTGIQGEKDPFSAGRIKTFLENAESFLLKRKKEDQESSVHEFGTLLKKQGDFHSGVAVSFSCPTVITLPEEGEGGPHPLRVKILPDSMLDGDRLKSLLQLAEASIEVEGGWALPCSGSMKTVAWRGFDEQGECELKFVPFERRVRLYLSLSLANVGSVKVMFYLETETLKK